MTNQEIRQEIDKIFQTSNSPDELFDTFRIAINHKIKDMDMYKALLWNKALSVDEIEMYAEKICKEIPEFCFGIFLAVAKILDSTSLYGNNKVKAFEYFKKAAAKDKSSLEPYSRISEMYNKELDVPPLESIANFIEEGLKYVEEKSKLSFILARLYAKTGDMEKGKIYQSRGEDYQKNGE